MYVCICVPYPKLVVFNLSLLIIKYCRERYFLLFSKTFLSFELFSGHGNHVDRVVFFIRLRNSFHHQKTIRKNSSIEGGFL